MNEITTAMRLELVALGLVPTALVGLLGFMFREKWKQILARSLAEQTEQIKLKAQQDIEAYKVSLIAEVERAKAIADVAKNIANKHAMREYDALSELIFQLNAVPTSICTAAQLVPTWNLSFERRMDEYRKAHEDWRRLEAAKSGAYPFLNGSQRTELLELLQWTRAVSHLHLMPGGQARAPGADDDWMRRVAKFECDLEARVNILARLAAVEADIT